MRTALQRSNFRSFSFHPAASPKRLHSLADICQILDKGAPADPRLAWTVTEWLLVSPDLRTRTDPPKRTDAPIAPEKRLCPADSDRPKPFRTKYVPPPKPTYRPTKPVYQQTTLRYPSNPQATQSALVSSTSYASEQVQKAPLCVTETPEPMDVEVRSPGSEASAPPKLSEFNSIFEEAIASAESTEFRSKTPQGSKSSSAERQSVFRISAKPAASTPVLAPPAPPAAPKSPPVLRQPMIVKRVSSSAGKAQQVSYVFPQKPRDSLDAIRMIFAAEAEKSRPPVIDVDAVAPEPPKTNGNSQAGMLAQSNGKPVELPKPPMSPAFACPVPGCEKVYRRKCRVIEHLRGRHRYEGVPRFRCLFTSCCKSYARLDALKVHFRSENHKGYDVLFEPNNGQPHKEDSPEPIKVQKVEPDSDGSLRYKCKYAECTKSYSTKYRLNMHETACHGSNMEKPFVCGFPSCPKAYATKDSLTRHRRNYSHPLDGEPKTSDSEKPKPVEVEKPKEKELPGDFQDRVQELVELFDEI